MTPKSRDLAMSAINQLVLRTTFPSKVTGIHNRSGHQHVSEGSLFCACVVTLLSLKIGGSVTVLTPYRVGRDLDCFRNPTASISPRQRTGLLPLSISSNGVQSTYTEDPIHHHRLARQSLSFTVSGLTVTPTSFTATLLTSKSSFAPTYPSFSLSYHDALVCYEAEEEPGLFCKCSWVSQSGP